MEKFSMNNELEHSVYFEYLHPVFLIIGFEHCAKDAGYCFLKVARDVIEENNYIGSFDEMKLILSTAAGLIISRKVSSSQEQESVIANKIAISYRRRTRTWHLNPTQHANDDSQTPRIFDKDNVQTKGSESKPTIGAEVESVKNSKQVKSAFNALNKILNSLISRGDS